MEKEDNKRTNFFNCKACGGEMNPHQDGECHDCGCLNEEHGLDLSNRYYPPKKGHDPANHFKVTIDRLQGWPYTLLNRFTPEHIQRLKVDLKGDHSLKNIHANLPNKDQKYLNFFHWRITGQQLVIAAADHYIIDKLYWMCYDEFMAIKHRGSLKKTPRINTVAILRVVVDSQPRLGYIEPFLYTKFNLHNQIKERLEYVCQAQKFL